MLPSTFSSQRDLIDALGDHLRSLQVPFAGAHFRGAFVRENGLRFLTGCVEFRDQRTPGRGEVDYGSIVFVEEWTEDQWEAHGRLSRLISGQERIGDHDVKYMFPQSNVSRDFYFGVGGSPTWRITSHMVKDSEWREFYPAQIPLLGYDLKPFVTPAHAVNEWVFGIDHSMQPGASFQNQWQLLTVIPDLRAKVISAEWLPGLLHLDLALRVPVDEVQLQIIHAGASAGHQIGPAKHGEQQFEIPDDVRKLSIFVVDRAGDCVAQLHLASIYECYGRAKSEADKLHQARIDLAGGESDTVEFKPFMAQKDLKESEFVKTVIAFANTYGGRIYVGANDDGILQGETEVCRIFQSSAPEALAEQISRLKSLVREKVKPVPVVDVRPITLGVDPAVVAEVQRGGNPPYATHQNQIYVRRGATSRIADPTELRSLITSTDFSLNGGIVSNY
jgi:Putative DNA-binding domain